MRIWLFAAVAILALSLGGTANATNQTDDVPSDVAAWFEDEALDFILGNSAGATDEDAPDYDSALRVGRPFEVFAWTNEFTSGEKTNEQVHSLNVWIAAIEGSDGAIGTIVASRAAEGKPVEFQSYDNYAELGKSLLSVESGVLVSDPSIDSWLVLDKGLVTALNRNGRIQLPYPSSVEEYQIVVVQQYANATESGEGIDTPVGGGGALDQRPWWYAVDPAIAATGVALLVVGLVLVGRIILVHPRGTGSPKRRPTQTHS